MEELAKHRGHKDKDTHPHHHLHLFHLPGHHHHAHKDQQQQQTVTGEKYREVSSSIDEPVSQASSAPSSNLKLTVGRIVMITKDDLFSGRLCNPTLDYRLVICFASSCVLCRFRD